jgi:hypothetical protein
MLRCLWVLAAIGAAPSASAAELEYLRGSAAPAYTVSQTPGPLPTFAAPPPAALPLAGPLPAGAARPLVAVRPAVWNWTGFYFGANAGLALATSNFADPFGASVFGDAVRSPGFMAGGQIGFNWQAPGWRWVLGVEADADAIASDGTTTCFAASALTITSVSGSAVAIGRCGRIMGKPTERPTTARPSPRRRRRHSGQQSSRPACSCRAPIGLGRIAFDALTGRTSAAFQRQRRRSD